GDPAAVARAAAEKAEWARGAGTMEAGDYRAVLEPYAIGELLQWFGYDAWSALALQEERSFFTGRLGERVFDQRVSIADDALDAHNLPRSFDYEATPKQRVQLRSEERRVGRA